LILAQAADFRASYCNYRARLLNLVEHLLFHWRFHCNFWMNLNAAKSPVQLRAQLALGVVCWLVAAPAFAEDQIYLRNLNRIQKPVTAVTVEGVSFADSLITWDQIESGSIAEEKQAEFDKLLQQLGTPLFRIRLRLSLNEPQAALLFAEQLFPVYESSRGESSAMVCAALVRGRIALGRREQSAVPYLHYLSRIEGSENATNLLPVDPQTKICAALMPVWFDRQLAQEQVPLVLQALRVVGTYPREFHLYTGSLAIAAGESETTDKALKALNAADPIQADFITILQAQQHVTAGEYPQAIEKLAKLTTSELPPLRVLALYWSGVAASNQTGRARMQGALTLLRIPASYADQFPDLSAAALYEASKAVEADGSSDSAQLLRKELLGRFPETWHGRLLSTRTEGAREAVRTSRLESENRTQE
jgi:hypothetical protein